MDTVALNQIIAGGETLEVEFKGEEKAPLNDRELVEAVVCLANATGGLLLIGVEDDGRITGARPRHGQVTDPGKLAALIRNRTVPPVETVVEVLATGVGKTRLMGAFISYLHLAHGINNFFVMAANLTIYIELITDFMPNTSRYVFKGIAEFAENVTLECLGQRFGQAA